MYICVAVDFVGPYLCLALFEFAIQTRSSALGAQGVAETDTDPALHR